MTTDIANLLLLTDTDITSALKSNYDSKVRTCLIGDRGLLLLNQSQDYNDQVAEFAQSMYKRMSRDQVDLNCFLSGETGSGKSSSFKTITTEWAKLGETSSKKVSLKTVHGVQLLLSFFGSANIAGSLHATRFLFYQEFQFSNAGTLLGIKTLDYGLESNRIVSSCKDESNFDVFYVLLNGATREEKIKWHLKDSSHYNYLNNYGLSQTFTQDDFLNIKKSLKSIGIGSKVQDQIFSLLSGILLLGEVEFMNDTVSKQEACSIKNLDLLGVIAELFGVDPTSIGNALTFESKVIQNELCTLFLNEQEAKVHRDSIAKSLYSLIFSRLLEQINGKLCLDDCDTFLSILDIPGFRSFKDNNSLDQFLFNYTNEKIRVFTNIRIWNSFQDRGYKEGLVTIQGSSTDNTVVELISSANGIISVLDSETARAKKLAITKSEALIHLTDKMNDRFAKTPGFKSAKALKKKNSVVANHFTITHYADQSIEYDSSNFVFENAEVLHPNLVALFRGNNDQVGSISKFARSLFSDDVISTQVFDKNKDVVTSAQISHHPTRTPSTKKKLKKDEEAEENIQAIPTVFSKFRTSLDALCNALIDSETWIIVCISTSVTGAKVKNSWDFTHVKNQVTFHGVASLAKYQSLFRFPVSYRFPEFIEKFKGFFRTAENDATLVMDRKEVCQMFCSEFEWGPREVSLGSSEIFVSYSTWKKLYERLERPKKELKIRPMFLEESEASLGSDVSENDSERTDVATERESEFVQNSDLEKGIHFEPYIPVVEDDESNGPTPARRKWVCCTWCLTWWIPSSCLAYCGNMRRIDIRMAFREKVALNIIIYFFCLVLLFFIVGFGKLICPNQDVLSKFELSSRTDLNDPWVSAYGRVYQIGDIVQNHMKAYGVQDYMFSTFLGQDVSYLFYKANLFSAYCPGLDEPQAGWDNLLSRPPSSSQYYAHQAIDSSTGYQKPYLEYLNKYAKYRLAWTKDYVTKFASAEKKLIIIFDNVYDVSAYFNSGNPFFGPAVGQLFGNYYGQDASDKWRELSKSDPKINYYLNCMNNLFYIGTVDHRNDFACQFSNYILLATSILLVTVIGIKFLAALQFGAPKEPEFHDKFVIMMVPCYTEGPESLLKTLESLAVTKYDDKRKLLFIVADGMIIGSGNDKPTPQIVLDILGVDITSDQTLAYSFNSLGEGDRQHNMAKVYSGLYHVQGHSVPYILVVKVGKPSERTRPGNRGKRDTQMILMRYLSRVNFNQAMNPMELEIYHHMQNIIGVNPAFYEYVFMVDADTEVFSDSLNRLVSAMIHDSKIMGLCGETLISNEKESWITMIQVYEYFISHHLAKAFESLFGSVTCLPGCFCIYRVRTPTKNIPLLIAPSVIKDYSENKVDTLHVKNLLHLGEDRYLTTLMMKHFPKMKLSFTSEAKCMTSVPESWAVLKSQRRRWINSTVHNLLELVFLPQLCGFCCFSMRFVVFIDLFSTIVQPVGVLYIAYLIYSLVTSNDQFPVISVVLLAAIYGFQVIIFILKRQWAQIGWMLVYLISMPAFSFYLPIYSFWHFDDFSWGNTRVVYGEKNRKGKFTSDITDFDPKTIPLRKWEVFESRRRDSLDSRRNDFPFDEKLEFGDETHSLRSVSTAVSSQRQKLPPFSRLKTNSPMGIHNHHRGSRDSSLYDGYFTPTRGPSIYKEYNQMIQISGSTAHSSNSPLESDDGSKGSNLKFPSDEAILYQIRLIISSSDLNTLTKRGVRDKLGSIFNMDMRAKKSTINYFLEEILKGTM